MILTAVKTASGVVGEVARDWAGFMASRTGPDYPPSEIDTDELDEGDGDQVGLRRHPVVDVGDAWELSTTLTLAVPGIRHRYQREPAGRHTAIMVHPDGSWARYPPRWVPSPRPFTRAGRAGSGTRSTPSATTGSGGGTRLSQVIAKGGKLSPCTISGGIR
ncbi:hypothetical protein [Frankia tisae]|uniref:hypothetical protein n=1 Tax=Frankia tisae TaxID=2950104 RepID=UPI0021BEE798|nr:hypothetical protein [Frankia tisae]